MKRIWMERIIEASPASVVEQPDIPASPQRVPEISVIVTVTERPEPLAEFYLEYSAPIRALDRPFEFVFIAEPSYHSRLRELSALVDAGEPIRMLEIGQAAGEGTFLKAAVQHCHGDTVVMLPAYRRIVADGLPMLIREVETGADLAIARRSPRSDAWSNRLQSWALHAVVRHTIGGSQRDLGCGVRAIRRSVLRDMPLHGDSSGFLPLIARREGYVVVERAAPQHGQDAGKRIYSPWIYLRRLLDILGIYFLFRFREKPLRFFGLIGSAVGGVGFAILSVLTIQWLGGRSMAERPMLLLGVLLLVLGIQFLFLGLVGEIIVHHHASRNPVYRIRNR